MSAGVNTRGPASQGLFRAEALDASRRRLWGDLLLTHPPGTGAVLALVLGLVLAAAALLCFGEFTRTERVLGYLVPDGGVVGLRAPQYGVVAEVRVREGAVVRRGDPLLRIRDPRSVATADAIAGSDGGASRPAGAAALASIDAQLGRLTRARATEAARLERERIADEARLARLGARLQATADQLAALSAQASLQDRALTRARALAEAGHLPRQQVEALTRERLDLDRQHAAVRDARLVLEDEEANTRARLADFADRRSRTLGELDDRADRLRRERIDTGGRSDFWLRAPHDGRVAALSVVPGESARPDRDLLTLVADGARMQAVLLVPSRAIGFVRPGQDVRLLYDAFPFTRFGVHAGEVVAVSGSVLAPHELDAPAQAQEPVYKVRVRPASDVVEAYGRRIPLQAGMALEADLALERRRLWRWLFEPILALQGRL